MQLDKKVSHSRSKWTCQVLLHLLSSRPEGEILRLDEKISHSRSK